MQHNVTFSDLLSLCRGPQYDGNIMNDTGVRCTRKAAPSMHDYGTPQLPYVDNLHNMMIHQHYMLLL